MKRLLIPFKKKLLIFTLLPLSLYAYDNAHFYRATNLFHEPRFERKLLTTFDVSVGYGSTSKARNKNGKTVPLLNIYGNHNMNELGIGVPNKNLSNVEDVILKQLALTPSRNSPSNDVCSACPTCNEFATYSIYGDFHITEALFSYIQNAAKGFFVQVYLPVRQLKIDDICFKDCSPTDEICPNINTPIWQAFKCKFDDILCKYDLSKEAFKKTGIGDLSLLLGWTYNYQDTEVLDFVDVTFRFGLLAPTGAKKDEDKIFSLPLGYNGHVGIPLSGDFSVGLYEWLTIWAHIDAIFFADVTRNIRMKTGLYQSGLIKLAKGKAKIDRGSLWNAGIFIKADHIYRGLSFLFGYIFSKQNSIDISPCDDCFSSAIANSDEMLKGWKMHTLNFLAEYDFTKEDSTVGTRIGLFYNLEIGGKRLFKTNMVGGNFGIDITWNM